MAIHAFRPDDHVPATGTYWVSHSLHRPAHLGRLAKGDIFPLCNVCGDRVLYEFAQDSAAGAQLTADPEFESHRSSGEIEE